MKRKKNNDVTKSRRENVRILSTAFSLLFRFLDLLHDECLNVIFKVDGNTNRLRFATVLATSLRTTSTGTLFDGLLCSLLRGFLHGFFRHGF